ncbi:hypothetical protein SDC9_192915 [bioreactor metagenome]|uniref:Uncharacterized protein n=1 Tax=bioreactor metagenome TaxID=1076179 RepID=A0A645I285_9ZZZZ
MLLDGALPLPQADGIAELVAQHLHLHMAGGIDVLFQIKRPVPKGGLGLPGGGLEGGGKLARLPHQADAPPPAPRAGLEQHRVAHFGGRGEGALRVGQQARARNDRYARRLHGPAGLVLVAHAGDHRFRRADEGQPVRPAGGGEGGVFGEEAVARVNGLGPGDQRGADDAPGV